MLSNCTLGEVKDPCTTCQKTSVTKLIIDCSHYIKLFFTVAFWGGAFIAGKIISESVQPFTAATLRFLVGSFFLVIFTRRKEGKFLRLDFKQTFLFIILGLSGIVGYNYFFFSGLTMISPSRASLIIALTPAVVSIFSALFLGEKLSQQNILGIIISLFGAAVVISKGYLLGIFKGNLGSGELLIIGCVICWMLYSVLGKAAMKSLPPVVVITFPCLFGTIALLPPAYLETGFRNIADYPIEVWFSIFYLGFFGTFLGFWWYYEGINKIGVSRTAVFMNFVPIWAIALDVLILKEKITISLIIGAFLVISGVYLTNRRKETVS